MFKVGDKVKIRRDSEYANQSTSIGIIRQYDGEGWYIVEFGPWTTNSYRECDLEFAIAPDKKKIKQYGIVSFMASLERR
jgi:hypothetical protein